MKLLTVEEICTMFNVDRTTIWRWRKQGLPFIQLGRSIRFSQGEVENWVELQKYAHETHYEIDGNVTYIYLYHKKAGLKKAMIDTNKLWEVKPYHWKLLSKDHSGNSTDYAVSHIKEDGKNKTILLHRLLFDFPEGLVIDHINGEGLDNRLSNLRAVDYSTNNLNTRQHRESK